MTPPDITLSGVGGEYMQSAVLVEWRVADGARVSAGDVVAVAETAKAATEVEATADGVIHILARAGEEIAVGAVLARIGDVGAPGAGAAPNSPMAAPIAPGMARKWPAAFASPLARRLAAERGIDLRGVPGSGPGGRIVRDDLPISARARPADGESAGFTIAVEVDAAALLAARADCWDAGTRPSLGDMVALAARDALHGQDLRWAVTVLDDGAMPPPDGLAIIDLSPFGAIAFTPPRLACRAVLGMCALPAAASLRLSLAADARDLSCLAAARFLATLRAALEAAVA